MESEVDCNRNPPEQNSNELSYDTRLKVLKMLQMGVSVDTICSELNINLSTVRLIQSQLPQSGGDSQWNQPHPPCEMKMEEFFDDDEMLSRINPANCK